MAGRDRDEEMLHIVMFPWLAFGHLIPFLELSNRLAEMGHRISFVSTPRNIQRLLPNTSPNSSSHQLNFISLPLPRVENLPDQAESTTDLPIDDVPYLKKAYDGLQVPLSNFLESSKPDWIIHDFISYWVPSMAAKHGIPSVFLSLFNASFNAFVGPPSISESSRSNPEQLCLPPEWIPFPSNLAFRKHEIASLSNNLAANVSGATDVFRFAKAVEDCSFVAIRSSMELEPEMFNLLEQKLFEKPVVPIGFLPPPRQDKQEYDWARISDWLDKHKQGSVTYVALGTEAALSQQEITEMALGLELSDLPFFWVLRKPSGFTEDPFGMLPVGFEERTKGRGYLCNGWAPQPRILGHASVGCFLTHCGWNSIIEGFVSGCSLVLLPFIHDQAINARMLVWKNMGLEIERDDKDGLLTRESVSRALRTVQVEEEGQSLKYRAKAKELKEMFGDKVQNDKYLEDFIRHLKVHKSIRRLTSSNV
ncbi:hypothetical protein MKW94_025111 [Papaver nudicaule]|uniref:Uncharacterized protein n=1 Tax=Papaver nudicaule TaxID=74823 RepID=A0AA41VIE1_PAPNU|nr:hypothetical protein [Papaver nudicaule]